MSKDELISLKSEYEKLNIKLKELSEEELDVVTGGANNTGDVDANGNVYFKFPSLLSSMSGFYSKASLEQLCTTYSAYASLVKQFVSTTPGIKSAVIKLYGSESAIPAAVKNMMC